MQISSRPSNQVSCMSLVGAHLTRAEGLQTTASESVMPKFAQSKKKGKKSGPRQRQVRITNTHLKMDIDLSKDYVPQI